MAPPRSSEIVMGLDVGKSSHWARVATHDGEVLASKPVASTRLAPRFSASPSPAQRGAQAKPKIASRPNQKRGASAQADTPLDSIQQSPKQKPLLR